MRSLVSTILILLICLCSQAQLPPALQWQKCIGGSEKDEIHTMVLTTDGGLIMAGLSYSSNGDVGNNYGMSDVLIVKTDLSGNILWRRNYGGSGDDFIRFYNKTI